MNPFYGKPIHGKLRNGMTFTARRLIDPIEAPSIYGPERDFVWHGRDSEGVTHLWTRGGFWRSDLTPHPFDMTVSDSVLTQ